MTVRPCDTEDFGRAADALEEAGFGDLAVEMNLSLDALFDRHESALAALGAMPPRFFRGSVTEYAFPERPAKRTKKAARRKRRAAPETAPGDDLFS